MTAPPVRILGIDPGLQITGYACLDMPQEQEPAPGTARAAVRTLLDPTLVEAGVIRLPARESIARRLDELFTELCEIIEQLRPQRMVVEQLFSHYKHVRTSIIMGHARGVVLLAGQRHGLQLDELAATEVKKAIVGRGHATKRQVQLAVMTQCGLSEPPEPPDVADAIAIALCAARRLEGDEVEANDAGAAR